MDFKTVKSNYLDNEASELIIGIGYDGYVWHKGDEVLVPVFSALMYLESLGFAIDITHMVTNSTCVMGYIREWKDRCWLCWKGFVESGSTSSVIRGCIKKICRHVAESEIQPECDETDM